MLKYIFVFVETDGTKVVSVKATIGNADMNVEINYTNLKIIGSGSFGVVYQATMVDSGDTIAIKKVLQDRRFKVRRCTLCGWFDVCTHPTKHCND